MNTLLRIILISAILFSSNPARAAESPTASKPLILPTNPFYFLKELSRGAQKTLTFNAFKKAELELKILNEKFAELKKLNEVISQNDVALRKTLDNYQKEFETLSVQINNLLTGSKNYQPEFIKSFINSAFTHLIFLSELSDKTSEKSQRKINELTPKIIKTIVGLSEKNLGFISDYLDNKSQGQNFEDRARLFKILKDLEKNAAGDFKNILMEAEEDLLFSFYGRFEENLTDEKATLSIFNQLPLDYVQKLELLDELREITEGDIKNYFNLARQDILVEAMENRKIRRSQAEEIIEYVRGAIIGLNDEKFILKLKSKQIDALVSRAVFNLKQADAVFEIGDYNQAFSLASGASAAIRFALREAIKFGPNFYAPGGESENILENIVKKLKTKYDALVTEYKTGVSSEIDGELKELFSSSEESLAVLSDLINKKAKPDLILTAVKESRILLLKLEYELEDILNKSNLNG